MKRIILSFFIPLFLIILSSCEKKETPVKRYNRGGLTISSIDMGTNYENQHFYDLSSGKIVKSVIKTTWDFSFTCDGSNLIELNTSKNMLAVGTGSTNFDQKFDTTGMKLKMDFPGGNPDSFAIGKIKGQSQVFIVSLGHDLTGNEQGLIKIQFTLNASGSVDFVYGPLFGTEKNSGTLKPETIYNRVFYSVLSKSIVLIEPPKNDFDFVITQYLHYFLEPEITPYLVAGALLNPYNTKVSKINGLEFTDVGLKDTINDPFVTIRDIIGYDWKVFNLSKNQYTIVPNRTFVIQDSEGFYYKLRFVDFYNDKGIKGHPKFEFLKI